MDGAYDGDFIGYTGDVGEMAGDDVATLPVRFERCAGAVDGGRGHVLHEGEFLAGEELHGEGFAIGGAEFGFVVEEVELGGAALHEEVDQALGFRGEVGGAREGELGGAEAAFC